MKSARIPGPFVGALERLSSEPRPEARSRPSRFDLVFGVVVALVAGAEFLSRPELTPVALGVLLVAAPAIAYRRVHPFGAMAAAFLASATSDLYALATGSEVIDMGTSMFLLVLPYNLFRWGSGREIASGLLLFTGTFALGIVADDLSTEEAIGGTAVLTVAFVLGSALRLRARNRAQTIENAKSRERERIARDLHDTVAHHVSGIAVLARAGVALGEGDPKAAIAAIGTLRTIADEASKTLDEMRAMVGTLRGDAAAEFQPHTGFVALASLADVDGALPVRLEITGNLEGVAEAVGGAIHRIAQEAVTNARRHARGATRVDVRVEIFDDSVRLEVSDDGQSSSRSFPDSGYGLIGMRERAALLGGSLEVGPRVEGGWRVVAALPRRGSGS